MGLGHPPEASAMDGRNETLFRLRVVIGKVISGKQYTSNKHRLERFAVSCLVSFHLFVRVQAVEASRRTPRFRDAWSQNSSSVAVRQMFILTQNHNSPSTYSAHDSRKTLV